MSQLKKCIFSAFAILAAGLYLTVNVSSEVVTHHPCNYNTSRNCTVHDVVITPCPEAASDEPCILYHGTNCSMTFGYTPKFSGKLMARAYSSTFLVDLPFLDMDTDACKFTQCPAVKDTKQYYTFSMPILDVYPTGPYTVKWRLWNEDNEECCFLYKIKIL